MGIVTYYYYYYNTSKYDYNITITRRVDDLRGCRHELFLLGTYTQGAWHSTEINMGKAAVNVHGIREKLLRKSKRMTERTKSAATLMENYLSSLTLRGGISKDLN